MNIMESLTLQKQN